MGLYSNSVHNVGQLSRLVSPPQDLTVYTGLNSSGAVAISPENGTA